MKNKLLLLFLCLLIGVTTSAQSIVVNDPGDVETSYTAEELIENVLLSGSLDCVSIELTNLQENPGGVSNVSERSWGYFKSDGADFPFEEGIILSSGFAVSAEGPNNAAASTDIGNGWGGDTDLETLLNNTYGDNSNTNNATVFEFTFTSALEEVAFDFIFASEEYEDSFECSVGLRDGFAFFISGPGIPDTSGVPFGGENIGTVPYTDIPVNTGSIHLDTFDCNGTQVQNVDFFPLYYVSNSPVNDPTTVAHEFDGRTISLTARATIIPGEEYTMKMVIADRGDSGYDSAVFLRAGSFDIGEVDLGEDILISTGEANCEGDIVTLSAGEYTSSAEYIWYQDGAEIAGADDNLLDVTETGTYMVEVYYSDTCIVDDEVIVEFFPNPEVELGDDGLVCPGEPVVLNATPANASELQNITYTWYIDGVEQTETTSTFDATEAGTYMVEVTGNQCVVTDQVVLGLVNFQVDLGDPIDVCGVDPIEIEPTVTGADDSNATYEWNTGATTPSITVSNNGEYWVDVTIDGCTERGTATVTFYPNPAVDLGEDFSKCSGDVVQIDATPSNISSGITYTWFLNGNEISGSTGATLDVLEEGTYMVEVDNNGCIGTSDIVVTNYMIDNCAIPEGISPNGDNVNDCVDLQFLADELGIDSFKVYNRHGRLVFEKDNYVNEFCGMDQDGNELPTGTYYYVLKLNNSNQIYQQVETGWIYINREI